MLLRRDADRPSAVSARRRSVPIRPTPASRRSRNASVAASSSLASRSQYSTRRSIHRGEDRPLGVPTEIRRSIAGRMPDRIDRSRRACARPGAHCAAAPAAPARGGSPPCAAGSAPAAARSPRAPADAAAARDPASPRPPPSADPPSRRTPRSCRRRRRETATPPRRRHADISQPHAQRAPRPAVERHVRQHRGDRRITFRAALWRHHRPSCCAAAARASSSVKPNSEKSCIRIGYRMPSRWSYSCCTTPAWKPDTSRATGRPSQSTPR